MSLADDLRAAAKRGDAERVVELIEGATEKERRAAGKEMGGRLRVPRDSAAWQLAWVGTQTAREATQWWFFLPSVPVEELARVVTARGTAYVATLVRSFERGESGNTMWPVIRALVKQGSIELPDPGAYTRALVTGVRTPSGFFDTDSVYAGLLADPELLERDVWRIFEVDVAQELANAHFYERRDRPGTGKPVGNCWTYGLTRLAAEGVLDRQRLLDESLAALQRDFRPSAVGWYAKLHEALAPSRSERQRRLDAYLALLGSPIAAVVKEGITGLKAIEGEIPGEELARAAAPALSQPQKAISVDVLRLLGRAAARDEEARSSVLATVAEALGHERADVQERALDVLEANELDEHVRGVLLGLADAVAPPLRQRVAALTGFVAEEPAAEPATMPVEPARPRLTPATAAAVRAPLEPVGSVDDLIELSAALLEGRGTGDDAERFLEGVSRLWPDRPAGFDRRAGGIVKRATELTQGSTTDIGGAEIVARVVLAWAKGARPPKRATDGLLGFIGLRAIEVANRVRGSGKPRSLLAFPTHCGGWIDPAALAERRGGEGRFFNRPDRADLDQALLRATELPPIRLQARVATRKPMWGPEQRGVELVVKSVAPALAPVADRLVGKDAETRWGFSWDPWGGVDELGMRWALTILPGDLEPAYGRALRDAVGYRDGPSAYGHPEIVLEHALDPHVPISELGWQAVAAGLLGKPQEVKRAAVDVVVAAIPDARFDAAGLAVGLAWLVENGLGKASRLEQPLREAGRVSQLHAAQVARTIVAFSAACSATPAGLVAPLAAAHELAMGAGLRIDGPAERVALERIASEVSGTSKLGRAARGLLAG